LLQSDTNGTGLSQSLRARPNAAVRRNAPDDAQNIDYIRKELSRLGKMARHLQRRELAHFIDVAAEVAGELHGPNGKTRNT
jgi:hypothetical protein